MTTRRLRARSSLRTFLCVILCWWLSHGHVVDGRVLDSQELLVGTWNITLRCSPGWFRQNLFPLKRQSLNHKYRDYRTTKNSIGTKFPNPFQIRSFPPKPGSENRLVGIRSRAHECQLRIFANGTFQMTPTNSATIARIGNESDILPLRGYWKLYRNPYCVTDRYHDELVLTSYPRVQTRLEARPIEPFTPMPPICRNNNTRNNNESTARGRLSSTAAATTTIEPQQPLALLRKGSIHMQCRLGGHFSPGKMTRRVTQNQDGFYQQCYYGRGKLFHGVLVWLDSASSFTGSKEGDNRWLASPPRRSSRFIVTRATFTGRRMIQPPSFLPTDEEDDYTL